MSILESWGPVGRAEATILINSTAIMLAIVAPTIVAIAAFAFWFRASNTRATYRADWAYSGRIELVVWSIPTLTVILLGGVTWLGAHQLDPRRPIVSDKPTIDIQVISLDWKWLFIYPEANVASLNELVVPVGQPLRFTMTSASVMNTFFIPQLGSMIYVMNGMQSELFLQADKTGTLRGLSAHFSGDGFPGMHFPVRIVEDGAYRQWIETAAKSDAVLDRSRYEQLAKQSLNDQAAVFRVSERSLFKDVVSQTIPPGPGPEGNAGTSGSAHPQGASETEAARPAQQRSGPNPPKEHQHGR